MIFDSFISETGEIFTLERNYGEYEILREGETVYGLLTPEQAEKYFDGLKMIYGYSETAETI